MINNTLINNSQLHNLTRRQAFWYLFRIISSNQVGRVLLYRLLIEIRRRKAENWCFDVNVPQQLSIKRNNYRGICIEYASYSAFSVENPRILFNCKPVKHPCIAVADNRNWKVISHPKVFQTLDISLFHELLHWFHYLRDTQRYNNERTAFNYKIKLTEGNIGKHFWPYESNQKWKVSASPWISFTPGVGYNVNFEEIRNILGTYNSMEGYKNGDDLSENLYRISRKQFLRFSHNQHSYFENEKIITQIETDILSIAPYYAINVQELEVRYNDCEPILSYTDKNLLEGISYCKYPKNDINYEMILPKRRNSL